MAFVIECNLHFYLRICQSLDQTGNQQEGAGVQHKVILQAVPPKSTEGIYISKVLVIGSVQVGLDLSDFLIMQSLLSQHFLYFKIRKSFFSRAVHCFVLKSGIGTDGVAKIVFVIQRCLGVFIFIQSRPAFDLVSVSL